MHHTPMLREEMTFASPSTGDPVGLSHLVPQSVEDLECRLKDSRQNATSPHDPEQSLGL